MKSTTLLKLVLTFTEEVSPAVLVSYGDKPVHLNVEDTLAVWMQVPDCSYSAMFLGWLLAKGYDISSFGPDQLAQAVQVALVGDNKNVMFDWLGDTDEATKPH